MEAFFRGSHTTNFVTCGFSKSYNQAAEVPSSNVTCTSPRSPSINCRIMLAFVSMTHSITTLPTEFITAIEMLSLCTSMPIYLVLVIKGCSFPEGLSRTLKTYSKKGAPFILRRITGHAFGRLGGCNCELKFRYLNDRERIENGGFHRPGLLTACHSVGPEHLCYQALLRRPDQTDGCDWRGFAAHCRRGAPLRRRCSCFELSVTI